MTVEHYTDSKGVTEPLLDSKRLRATSFLRVVFLGFIVATPCIVSGMTIAFSAIALPQMDLDIDKASWYGSLPSFGSPLGSILIGLIIDRFGRKPSFIMTIMPSIIGWFFISMDLSITTAFVGRFLTGMALGSSFICQVYAAECITVNHDHLRNSFTTWGAIANSFGIVLTYILSLISPYQNVAMVATALSVASIVVILVFIPESPQWLYHCGMTDEAKLAETKLRICQPALQDTDVIRAKGFEIGQTPRSIKTAIQKLKRKEVYKPLFIMTIWLMISQFTGGAAVNAYKVNIISMHPQSQSLPGNDTTENNEPNYGLTVVSGFFGLAAVSLSSFSVTHVGNKKLFLLSALGLAFGMAALAGSLSLMASTNLQELFDAVHVVSVWIITFSYALGVVTVPISVLGDMFPLDAKGFACIPKIGYSVACGIAVKLHLYLFDYFEGNVFFLYAFICLVTIIYMQIFVHETVGKSLDEIGQRFRK